jgi:Flp pilus assembly protein TadB
VTAPAEGPDGAHRRNPAAFVASATLPAIPLGIAIAAAGHWWLGIPVLVWAGLILAGGNAVAIVGFAIWYERRRRRHRRQWQEQAWQEGLDDE